LCVKLNLDRLFKTVGYHTHINRNIMVRYVTFKQIIAWLLIAGS